MLFVHFFANEERCMFIMTVHILSIYVIHTYLYYPHIVQDVFVTASEAETRQCEAIGR